MRLVLQEHLISFSSKDSWSWDENHGWRDDSWRGTRDPLLNLLKEYKLLVCLSDS